MLEVILPRAAVASLFVSALVGCGASPGSRAPTEANGAAPDVRREARGSAADTHLTIGPTHVGPIDAETSASVETLRTLFPDVAITEDRRPTGSACFRSHFAPRSEGGLRATVVSEPPNVEILEVVYELEVHPMAQRHVIRAVEVRSQDYALGELRIGASRYRDVASRFGRLTCRFPDPEADCFDHDGGEVLCAASGTPYLFEFFLPTDHPVETAPGNYVAGDLSDLALVAIVWVPRP